MAQKTNQTSPNKQPGGKSITIDESTGLILLAMLIPFIAWIIAAFFNPNGWASNGPTLLFYIPLIFASEYPLIALGVIAAFAFVAAKFGKKIFAKVLLIVMTLYAALIYHIVSTAGEDEFA